MKKITLKTLLGVSLLLAHHALAYVPAPQMIDELGAVFLPSAPDLTKTPVAGVPTPTYHIDELIVLPTVLIAQNTTDDGQMLDVTLIDDFIDDISPNARHYPPNFPNRTLEYHASTNVAYLLTWLKPFASRADASFDVLLRSAKLAIMGRNMGVSEYAVLASDYLKRAIMLKPDHDEANFLYGMMLSEGGGFKEGQVYLEKAISLGYLEAEQSLIQAQLIAGDGDRQAALLALKALQERYPDNTQIAKQIQILENGGYYIWNIPDNQLRIKPLS